MKNTMKTVALVLALVLVVTGVVAWAYSCAHDGACGRCGGALVADGVSYDRQAKDTVLTMHCDACGHRFTLPVWWLNLMGV